MYLYEEKCTKCDYKKTIDHFEIGYNPLSGAYQSIIEYKFCGDCNGYEKWFLGEGLPDVNQEKYGGLNSMFLKGIKSDLERKLHTIDKLKNKRNFINQFFIDFKIRNINTAIGKNEAEIKLLEEQIRKSITDSLSIKYYKQKSPVPRCLNCSGETSLSNPMHKCGGELNLGLDKSVHYYPDLEYGKIMYYDSEGYVFDSK